MWKDGSGWGVQSVIMQLFVSPCLQQLVRQQAQHAALQIRLCKQAALHWWVHACSHLAPSPPPTLLQVKEQNLAEAIGVSNFNAKRLKAAAKRLQQAGINLASNQVGRHECRQAKAECNKLTKRCLGGLFFV